MPTMDQYAECLFDCLPATTRHEIRRDLRKIHKLDLDVNHISQILCYVRRNSERVGYTVPHSNRGRYGKGEDGWRFQAVLIDKGRAPYMDGGSEAQVIKGLIATVRIVRTMEQNEAVAFKVGASYLSSASAQRAWRSYVKHLRRAAEDAGELLEALGVA